MTRLHFFLHILTGLNGNFSNSSIDFNQTVQIKKSFAKMMSNIKSMAPRIKETSRYAWKRLRNLKRKIWLYEKYNIYIKKLTDNNLSDESCSINKDIHFRLATLEDIPFVAKQFISHFGNNGEDLLSKRLADGENLIIGYLNNDLQSICYLTWLSENETFFLAAKQTKNLENTVCTYKTIVPIQFRRMGIGKAGKVSREKIAYELGYRQIFNFIEIHNTASLKITEGPGLKVQGKLARIVLFNRQYIKIRWIGNLK